MKEVRAAGPLRYVVSWPNRETGDPRPAILFLHNRAADMHALVRLADAIGSEDFVYVFPNAPFLVSTGDARERGWCWQLPGEGRSIDSRSAIWGRLSCFVHEISATVAAGRDVVIGGFSQGGACALQYGLSHATSVAGIIGLSTWFAGDPMSAPSPRNLPVFLAHGVDDLTVPIAVGRACKAEVEAAGHSVVYAEYEMRHELSLAEIRDLRRWLRVHWPAHRFAEATGTATG